MKCARVSFWVCVWVCVGGCVCVCVAECLSGWVCKTETADGNDLKHKQY